MINLNDLTKTQKSAVTSTSKAIRIVAGAGSGKTRVLTMRISYLVKELGIDPRNILAITFTNKAANEMKVRIEEMIGIESGIATISTIHSLCARILRKEIGVLGYPHNFTIADSEDQKSILKMCYKEYGFSKNDYSYASVLSYISNNKCAMIDPEKAMDYTGGDQKEIDLVTIYRYYDRYLNHNYTLDFDDLIIKTVMMFKKFPKVLNKYAELYRYILVDEFQDIDPLQYDLIKLLSSYHQNVCVVGDPDQTIYSWRGADVNIILNFEADFKNVETIVLDENFRSSGNILGGSNCIIKNNHQRIDKNLFTNKGMGDKIIHSSFASEIYEGDYVAEQIAALKTKGWNYRDIAILYRANYQSRFIEKSLTHMHIPYIIYGGTRFYDRAEVKDILCYLRMVVGADDLALIRTINQPKRGIGEKSIDALRNDATFNEMTMFELLNSDGYEIKNKGIKDYLRVINKLRNDAKTLTMERLLENVLNDTGYRIMLEKNDDNDRLENIKELLNDIADYQKTYPDSNLEEYLQMISLYTDKENNSTGDCIKMMTIHSAKGLEFDGVFIIGMNEGVFPSERSLREGLKGLEEERRLAYVAYTRARKNLFLTESRDFSYVTGHSKTASRFIGEIADEYIIHNTPEDEERNIVRHSLSIGNDDPYANVSVGKVASAKNIKKFKKGDLVLHAQFGKGKVILKDGDILSIAFEYPYGVKKILAKAAPLEKLKN